MKRLLLIGAGHAHALVLAGLAKHPLPRARIALVAPQAQQVYSGMVPGYLAGHYRFDDIVIDFARLAQRAGAELLAGSVAELDAARCRVTLADGRSEAYDFASLNVGSLTRASLPGAEFAVPLKPLRECIERVEAFQGSKIAIVGGGAAGAEIAMALAHRGFGVALYYDAPIEPLLAAALRRSGIEARIGAAVLGLAAGPEVVTESTRARFDLALLATGPAPHPWLRASGLAVDDAGFALIDETLRSASHDNVFAVGDCATLRDAPQPKSGVQAVRQAPVLAANLRVAFGSAGRIKRYGAQRRSLMLVSCGSKRAIALWGGVRAEGGWLWRLKDAIDRRWIGRFR